MSAFWGAGGTSYHKRNERRLKRKFNKKFKVMQNHNYINPRLIRATAENLKVYAAEHPESKTPMAEACANIPTCDRERFVRAARRLGWNVCKTAGHIYENGFFVW